MTGCVELLQNDAQKPDDSWTNDELIARDVAVVRLTIITKMIRIECWLNDNPETQRQILKLLCSDDAIRLDEADRMIAMIPQGISEDDVKTALAEGCGILSPSRPTSLI